MARMVRKQNYIEPRYEALLKRLDELRGVSEAELILQAIDRHVRSGRGRRLPPDPAAREQAYQFMLHLYAQGSVEGEGRR